MKSRALINMVAVVEIKSFEEKEAILNYLKNGTVPSSFKHRSGEGKFLAKCEKFVLGGDDIFYNFNNVVKRVVVKEDLNAIRAICLEEHSINHIGNF